MNTFAVSLSELVNSSVEVLRRPSVFTFERYEKRGNLQTALLYVLIGAVVAAILGLPGGVWGLLNNAVSTVVQFLIFVGVVYYLILVANP